MTTAHDDDQDHDMTPLTARRDAGDHTMTDTSREAVELAITIANGNANQLEHHFKEYHTAPVLEFAFIALRNDASMLSALLVRAEAAEAERDAAKAETDKLREAIGKLARGAVPQGKSFSQWHDRYQDMRAFARAALQETTND
ncbi:MAG: hypothetical protein EP341_05375 [Sphingomonadales bacterium]|nr:MAG: hypothetical protein EP341_05375 [Sphingomonadales bacterium]